MSELTHAQRSRQWVAEQLEQLGNLRNASPRDPSFKHWRQHTLTVLQRIWPRHASRSDRFRRVVFTPGTTRTDGAHVREAFTRGCAEAERVLRELIDEIDTVGVPEPGPADANAPAAAATREDDFPVLELSTDRTTAAPRHEADDETLRDLGGASALAPEPAPDASRDPAAPAPPTLKVALTRPPVSALPPTKAATPREATAPRAPSAPREDDTLRAAPHEGDARRTAPGEPKPAPPREPAAPEAGESKPNAHTARPRKAAQKPRLKEMLGLGHLDRSAHDVPPHEVRTPSPPPAAAHSPAVPAKPEAAAPTAPAPTAKPVPAPPADRAPDDLLSGSPLFALQGRPVQRVTDATEFLEPDAVALATLANDLARLGVPETERERLRVALRHVAAQIETRAPEWITIQMLVAPAMGHPELARRLMPILLPWLPRAG